VIAHARETSPRECCGILLGTAAKIVEAVPATNRARSPNRFLIDPKDHIDARRKARHDALSVVGFYHSHPHSEPYPSESDKAEATYVDSIYVIVGGGDFSTLRAFRLERRGFIELELIARP